MARGAADVPTTSKSTPTQARGAVHAMLVPDMVTTRSVPRTASRRLSRRGEPVWELARLYPEQGSWTEDEYLVLNTNRLVEYVDGCLEFLPMPTLFHQSIALFIYETLKAFVKPRRLGKVCVAPVPCRTVPSKYREPDVFFLTRERLKGRPRYPDGLDLAVEIVSGGAEDRRRDLVTKRAEYAKAGIPEYWIVDPDKQRIVVLTLQGSSYHEHGHYGPGQRATSVLLPGFSLDVDDVFAAGDAD